MSVWLSFFGQPKECLAHLADDNSNNLNDVILISFYVGVGMIAIHKEAQTWVMRCAIRGLLLAKCHYHSLSFKIRSPVTLSCFPRCSDQRSAGPSSSLPSGSSLSLYLDLINERS